ncbi:hypothetical protein [Peredibacter starrii]|uniref:Lipoprotein n=1 Tax=Peredibacter starrii TaxID=28202 RepID=A0AAX4HMQ3_9BACT|nr:hypothetical protein [Peredibacter starrii]WPU64445.1 hypothetical protein SOO65_17260 [Peredibacter starrii]
MKLLTTILGLLGLLSLSSCNEVDARRTLIKKETAKSSTSPLTAKNSKTIVGYECDLLDSESYESQKIFFTSEKWTSNEGISKMTQNFYGFDVKGILRKGIELDRSTLISAEYNLNSKTTKRVLKETRTGYDDTFAEERFYIKFNSLNLTFNIERTQYFRTSVDTAEEKLEKIKPGIITVGNCAGKEMIVTE